MYRFIRKYISDYYQKLMKLPGRINYVAAGFAIGVFFGFSVWHGLHLVLSGIFASLLRKSVAAALLGAMVFNPLTSVLILTAEFKLGRIISGAPPIEFPTPITYDLDGLKALWHSGTEIFLPLLYGSLVLGTLAAIISYFLVRRSLAAYRQNIYLKRHGDEPDAGGTE
jgi:hypothetical protein